MRPTAEQPPPGVMLALHVARKGDLECVEPSAAAAQGRAYSETHLETEEAQRGVARRSGLDTELGNNEPRGRRLRCLGAVAPRRACRHYGDATNAYAILWYAVRGPRAKREEEGRGTM